MKVVYRSIQRYLRVVILVCLFGVAACGCGPEAKLPEMISGDWDPPMLSHVEAIEQSVIALTFDEPVELLEAYIDPPVEIEESRWHEGALHIVGSTDFIASEEYWIDARVEDQSGNLSSVLVSVYGRNDRVPKIRINEFVCEGSSRHPDWVELRVDSSGNLAGLCLYEGSPTTWDSRFLFPDLDVEEGDYVVVHFKPEVIPEEIDEVVSPDESGGNDTHPEGWDFWVKGGDGIPNTTGGLTLTAFPGGPHIDAVLYTTKRYEADDEKRGFGTTSQVEIFDSIVEIGGWQIAGDFAVPEDGFDPTDSTATRSIYRPEDGGDTDTAADWRIAPTSGATPGYQNTDEVYQPN